MRNVYLDVCALCRPYDDQSYLRIRLETLAVHMIFKAIEARRYQMFYSSAHHIEISAISNEYERVDLLVLLEEMAVKCVIDKKIARVRAEELVRRGMGVADAAHLAFSETAKADFISCDDNLLRKCKKTDLSIWTGSPISFCEKEDLR